MRLLLPFPISAPPSPSPSSYRGAIIKTCAHFLSSDVVTTELVSAAKARGGCNNDWVLSLDLIKENLPSDATSPTIDDVTAKFEEVRTLREREGDNIRRSRGTPLPRLLTPPFTDLPGHLHHPRPE